MRTTVLITTYNRARWLDDLLAALEPSLTPGQEVLVVDNASTDHTAWVCEAHARRLPLRVLHEPRAGKRFAVESGVRAASGDLVVFADDDVVPESRGWVAAYERAAAGRLSAGFFGGPIRPWLPRGTTAPAWYRALAPASRAGFSPPEGPVDAPSFVGSNWAARRPALLEAVERMTRGRRESRDRWTGQELSLQRGLIELGQAGWFVPEAGVWHRVPRHEVSFRWLRAWKYKVGRAEAQRARREEGGPPRWRFRKIAENVAALARDGGPLHRKRVALKVASDAGFLVALALDR